MNPTKDYTSMKRFVIVFVCLLAGCLLWWKVVRFPPQIFGTDEDHFRAHVITPIPDSVNNLQVALDDLIIHPDVTYWFRFTIAPDDLEKIITFRSLQKVSRASPVYAEPIWWETEKISEPEIFEYESESLEIVLWWDASRSEVHYLYGTY